jgi:two-component system sensor histidine kinase KdpD
MLIMFFIIALLNGVLTSRVRRQEQKIRIREQRTNALYQLTKDLNTISGYKDVTKVAAQYILRYFKLNCIILIKNEFNKLEIPLTDNTKDFLSENEMSIASWVFRHSVKAGKYTDTLPSGDYTFYPLKGIVVII